MRALGNNEINPRTMAGDIRDFLLNRLRQEQDRRPWNERSEKEQRLVINAAQALGNEVVRNVVNLVAAASFPALKGTLEAVTVKNGLKAAILLSRTDTLRHELLDAQGKQVMVVVADPDQFMDQREDVAVRLDEPALPLEVDPETGEIVVSAEETEAEAEDPEGAHVTEDGGVHLDNRGLEGGESAEEPAAAAPEEAAEASEDGEEPTPQAEAPAAENAEGEQPESNVADKSRRRK